MALVAFGVALLLGHRGQDLFMTLAAWGFRCRFKLQCVLLMTVATSHVFAMSFGRKL